MSELSGAASPLIAFGNEEETMLLLGAEGVPYSEFQEPQAFVGDYRHFIPADLKYVSETNSVRTFLQNGSLIYDGGAIAGRSSDGSNAQAHMQGVNLERATAECAQPTEAAAAIQANERLLVNMLGNYVTEAFEYDQPQVAWVQRRVVDSAGNTRGCHDNFEVPKAGWFRRFREDSRQQELLMAYLATRSFMTGAGYVTPRGLRFAQKVEHTVKTEYYGYANSAYRTVNGTEVDTGDRIELRGSDINISPWAIKQRLGGAALFLTMLQTPPLASKLYVTMPRLFTYQKAWLPSLRFFNRVKLDKEGHLRPNGSSLSAADFQERMYETAAKYLPEEVGLGQEYQSVINEGIQYCQDFKKVLHGEADLALLTDRSDNVVKFSKIIASVQKGRDMGFDRTMTDVISQAWDLRYDNIEIKSGLGNKPRVQYGYGYKHRESGRFKDTVAAEAVEGAYYLPPRTTRAHIRGNLIRQDAVRECMWSRATLLHKEGVVSEKLHGLSVGLGSVVLRDPAVRADPLLHLRRIAP